MFFVKVEKVINALPEKVFEVLIQHDKYSSFRSITKSSLKKEGDIEVNGLGAVRSIESGSFKVIEEIVAFERPKRLGYKIIKSSPFNINHQLGDIQLEATADNKTRVQWVSKGKVTTPLLGWFFDKQVSKNGQKIFGSILKDIEKQLA